jgi:hypothetical protein
VGDDRRRVEKAVTKVTRCGSLSPLASQFDDFLFASIGEDGNALRLSIVSALAQLNSDPWQTPASNATSRDATVKQRLS